MVIPNKNRTLTHNLQQPEQKTSPLSTVHIPGSQCASVRLGGSQFGLSSDNPGSVTITSVIISPIGPGVH